jgi:hypothetical protein
MTVTIEVDGNMVEFPDEQTAQAFFANQGGGPAAGQPERGFGAMLYDNIIGNPDDGVNSPGERLGTWLNRAGESMTLGTVGDEAAAGVTGMLPGRDYESELERYRANEEGMSGLGRLSADLTGGVTSALGTMLIPGAGPALATAGTSGRGAGLMATLGRGIGTGAAMGGTYGFMEGEGGFDERRQEGQQGAAIGGALGGATAGLGRVVQSLMDRRVGERAIQEAARGAPTSEALRREGQALYGQIDDAGVAINPSVARERLTSIAGAMSDDGLDPIITPNANRVANRFRSEVPARPTRPSPIFDPRDGLPSQPRNPAPVPFQDLDNLRRIAGNAAAANPNNRADTRLSTIALTELDDFVQNIGPDDVTSGDLEALQSLIPRAREVWSRMSRSQLVDDAIEAGGGETSGYLGAGASGLRNQFGRILRNENLRRGFSDAELRVMNRVVRGTLPESIVYNLGSGLGQIASTATGTALGGLGLGIPGMIGGATVGAAASGAATRGAEAIARRNAEIARAVIANGRLPAQLPVADEGIRRIVEALALRTGVASGAQ